MQAAKAGTARYTGTMAAYYKIGATEGTKGLWAGLGPNIMRCVQDMISHCYDLLHNLIFNSMTTMMTIT